MAMRIEWKALLFCLLLPISAQADESAFPHSSRTLHLALSQDTLTIEYRLKIPLDQAWIEMAGMDTDEDGEVSAIEKRRYLEQKASRLLQNITVTCADKTQALTLTAVTMDSAIAQTFTLQAPASVLCTLRDNHFVDRPGSVRLRSDAGTAVMLQEGRDHSHAGRIVLKISQR